MAGAFLMLKGGQKKMDFGQALTQAKLGKSIKRKGWNGKNQFVYLIKGEDLQKVLHYGFGEYLGETTITDTLAIKTTSNQIQVGWLASQSDMLSNDWEVIE